MSEANENGSGVAALAGQVARYGQILEMLKFSPSEFDGRPQDEFVETVQTRIRELSREWREPLEKLTLAPIVIELSGDGEGADDEQITRHYAIRPLAMNAYRLLSSKIKGIADAYNAAIVGAQKIENEIEHAQSVGNAIDKVANDAYELLYALAPEIEKDRAWIESKVHPAQIMVAAARALELNNPFFQARGELASRMLRLLR